MTLRSTRRTFYKAGRVLGDVEAAKRGPVSYSRRVVRKHVYRAANSSLAQLLRGLGL